MNTATDEEWEEVTCVDGTKVRVLKNPPPPTPPLPVTDEESLVLDEIVEKMAKIAPRRGIRTDKPRALNEDVALCGKIDDLIAEMLRELKAKVPKDPAEKLFERLMKVADSWPDESQAWSLGLITIRYMDTMEYFVSYKGKFRGKDRRRKYSKEEALAGLKARGLTKR